MIGLLVWFLSASCGDGHCCFCDSYTCMENTTFLFKCKEVYAGIYQP